LRNFGLNVGMVGTVKFQARIQELVETSPEVEWKSSKSVSASRPPSS